MYVVVVGNEKGGAGKTTSTANLAALCGAGARVLAVDADPQGQLTSISFGVDPRPGFSLGHLLDASLENPPTFDEVCLRQVVPGVDLLPADRGPLERAESEMARDLVSVSGLRALLAQVENDYDLVLIDTPPRLLGLTTAALVAADGALCVMSPTLMHMGGASAFIERMRKLGASPLNPTLVLLGVLFNNVDKEAAETGVITDLVVAQGWPLFEARVPPSRLASKAGYTGVPVALASPKSPVTAAFAAVVQELMTRILVAGTDTR